MIRCYCVGMYRRSSFFADMAELADAPDLGSGVPDVQVQVLLSAGTEALRRNPVGREILGAFLV